MNMEYVLYFLLYLFSFIMVMGFDDWFMVWWGLEVNMFSFIVLVYDRNNLMSLEGIYKYFFVQSVSSGLFLFSLFMGLGVSLILFMKMGVGPFFFWYPSVIKSFSWVPIFFLMFFQKCLPLYLLSMLFIEFLWLSMLTVLVGCIGIFLESSLKGVFSYSSINQIGWITIFQVFLSYYWIVYLLSYGVMIYLICKYLMKNVMSSFMDLYKSVNFVLVYFVLIMGGFPPFLGFLMKIMVIMKMFFLSFFFCGIIIMLSVFMFYVYVRCIYSFSMKNKFLIKVNFFLVDVLVFLFLDLFLFLGILMFEFF